MRAVWLLCRGAARSWCITEVFFWILEQQEILRLIFKQVSSVRSLGAQEAFPPASSPLLISTVGVINSHVLSHIFLLITKIVIILESFLFWSIKCILHDKKALSIPNCQSSKLQLPLTPVGASCMKGAEHLGKDLWCGYENNIGFSHCWHASE